MAINFFFFLNRQNLFIDERVKETPTTRGKETTNNYKKKLEKQATKKQSNPGQNDDVEVYTNKTKRYKPTGRKL